MTMGGGTCRVISCYLCFTLLMYIKITFPIGTACGCCSHDFSFTPLLRRRELSDDRESLQGKRLVMTKAQTNA